MIGLVRSSQFCHSLVFMFLITFAALGPAEIISLESGSPHGSALTVPELSAGRPVRVLLCRDRPKPAISGEPVNAEFSTPLSVEDKDAVYPLASYPTACSSFLVKLATA